MWVIVSTDPEDEDYPLPDIFLNEDGSAKIFKDEVAAWKFMRRAVVQLELPPELLDFNTIELMRVH